MQPEYTMDPKKIEEELKDMEHPNSTALHYYVYEPHRLIQKIIDHIKNCDKCQAKIKE